MKLSTGVLFLFLILGHTAQAQTDAPAKPFISEPILPGGVVLPLYPADSPRLKHERIHEAERYNTSLKNKCQKAREMNGGARGRAATGREGLGRPPGE